MEVNSSLPGANYVIVPRPLLGTGSNPVRPNLPADVVMDSIGSILKLNKQLD